MRADLPILSVRGIRKSYPPRGRSGRGHTAREALRHVSLTIGAGESLAVVGESGCGKTTLVRSILGTVTRDEGEILFEGHPVESRKPGRLQAVFQDSLAAMNPSWSIARIIEEPLRLSNWKEADRRAERVRETARAVDLPEELLQRRPAALSTGQRQRAGIARAIATEPGLLLADEPTSALDPSLGLRILKMLNELRLERQFSLLLVTHDLDAAALCCERIVVMHDGRVVEEGATQEILDNPQAPETQSLVHAALLNSGLKKR